MTVLRCASELIDVEPSILELAGRRCLSQHFVSEGPVTLRLRRKDTLANGRAFEGSNAPWGNYELNGDVLWAHIPDDLWAAEAVVRIAWQICTHRQGGVLMHGSGFSWGQSGYAAIGKSTAGKSTLARLCCGEPGNAALLSDEMVQLFPDGRLFGSPFRSDTEIPGAPGGVQLRSVLVLTKGHEERLDAESAPRVLPELLGQLYRTMTDGVSQAECMQRVMKLVDSVGVQRLTFRKDPAVGPFLRSHLSLNEA